MTSGELTAEAVNKALDEFDELSREVFLKKYRIGAARGHYLVRNNIKYDAKAIVAAAHGYLPGQKPLLANEFHGGEASTAPLKRLGFDVVGPADNVPSLLPFEPGRLYHRARDIHQLYGGQERGGISTPDEVPFIFLFTGESGSRYGYEDKWLDDGSFEFTGEGRAGPMEFVRGNRAIRDQGLNGKDLLLFQTVTRKGFYRYVGCFGCCGYDLRPGVDEQGNPRQIIVFKLARTDGEDEGMPEELGSISGKSLAELRAAALAAAKITPNQGAGSGRKYYQRSAAVRDYVLARAKGFCEACEQQAPFKRRNGDPYLEPHHTKRLADRGPDHPRWVGAVCPSCHRNIHHGKDGHVLNEKLIARLADLEPFDG
jgi:5-methylcytosine-specific restriction protein A